MDIRHILKNFHEPGTETRPIDEETFTEPKLQDLPIFSLPPLPNHPDDARDAMLYAQFTAERIPATLQLQYFQEAVASVETRPMTASEQVLLYQEMQRAEQSPEGLPPDRQRPGFRNHHIWANIPIEELTDQHLTNVWYFIHKKENVYYRGYRQSIKAELDKRGLLYAEYPRR